MNKIEIQKKRFTDALCQKAPYKMFRHVEEKKNINYKIYKADKNTFYYYNIQKNRVTALFRITSLNFNYDKIKKKHSGFIDY